MPFEKNATAKKRGQSDRLRGVVATLIAAMSLGSIEAGMDSYQRPALYWNGSRGIFTTLSQAAGKPEIASIRICDQTAGQKSGCHENRHILRRRMPRRSIDVVINMF